MPTHVASFKRSIAVIVGINDYGNGIPRLTTAANDAARLAEILREAHGYEVNLVAEMATCSRLTELFSKTLPAQIEQDDRLLLYFAGHGIALDGDDGPQGYLIPQDAHPEDQNTFLAMTAVHQWLAALPCRHMLAILDCCFAGAFRWASLRDLRPLPTKLYRERYERFIRDPAWQVLTSAAYDQKALDVLNGRVVGERDALGVDKRSNSPFALALFEALAGAGDVVPKGTGDGVITASELYLYLRDFVEVQAEEQAHHRQTPGLWPLNKHDKGEYIFLVPGHELNLEPAPPLTAENNPYRGLKAYEEEHADLFFGRDALVERLATTVREQPLTVVLGASGTGKSSVVRAGLLPYLRKKAYPAGHEEYDVASQEKVEAEQFRHILPPMRPGESPLDTLTQMVVKLRTDPMREEATVDGDIATLHPVLTDVEAWLAANPAQCLLLVVDQFEELVTLCHDDAQHVNFQRVLADLLDLFPGRLRLVITLRTDFEPQFAQSPLAGHWQTGRVIVPPMNQAELRTVIEGPAAVRVLFFDPSALVDALIDEVIQTPGALPLLSFTLEQLYLRYLKRQEAAQQRGDTLERALIWADYMELGGVIGSLRTRADEEYAKLPDAAHQATMQRVMLRMVAVEGGEMARRRVPRLELSYPNEAENQRVTTVIQRLVVARLLVAGQADTDGEGAQDEYVEPAHDALVRAWDKLLMWKREADEYLPLQRRVTQAANEWARADEKAKTGLLWNNNSRLPQLQQVISKRRVEESNRRHLMLDIAQYLWPTLEATTEPTWLNRIETEFVQNSVMMRARVLKRIVGITLAVIVTLAGISIFAELQRRNANVQRDEAQRQAREARFTLSGRLMEQAKNIDEEGNLSGLLLAIEALKLTATHDEPSHPDAESYIWSVLGKVGGRGFTDSSTIVEDSAYHHRREGVKIIGITSDSHWLVTVNESHHTVSLWDLSNPGITPPQLVLPEKPVASDALLISPNGHWLMTENEENTIDLWNLATQNPATGFTRLSNSRWSFPKPVFSPDSRWMVSQDRNGNQLQLWDMTNVNPESGPTILPVTGRPQFIDANNQWLVTGDESYNTYLWDLRKQAHTTNPKIFPNTGSPIAISANGRWLVTKSADEHQIHLWDIAVSSSVTASRVLSENIQSFQRFAVSPDNQWLSTADEIGNVRLWNLNLENPADKPIALPGPETDISSIVFSSDSAWLATASYDDALTPTEQDKSIVYLWNLTVEDIPGSRIASRELENRIEIRAIVPQTHQVIIGEFGTPTPRTIYLWNWLRKSDRDQYVTLMNSAGSNSAISVDGRWLVASGYSPDVGESGDMRIWDLTSLEPSTAFDGLPGHQEPVDTVAISPSNHWLVTVSKDAAYAWDLFRVNPVASRIPLASGPDPIKAALSIDNRWLVIPTAADTIHVWDLNTSNLVARSITLLDPGKILDIRTISKDGRWLMAVSDDTTVNLWPVVAQDRTAAIKLGQYAFGIYDILISPDSRHAAVIFWGGPRDSPPYAMTIEVWDLGLAKPTLLFAHDYVLRANAPLPVAFSPDGSWLAVGETDATITLWNMLNTPPNQPMIFRGHTKMVDRRLPDFTPSGVNAVAFSPDSHWLVSSAVDKTLRLWQLSTDESTFNSVTNLISAESQRIGFSEDGSWLITHDQRTHAFWNFPALLAQTTTVIPLTLSGDHAAISPDKRWVVAGDSSRIRLWTRNAQGLLELACRTVGRNMIPDVDKILGPQEWETFFSGQAYRPTCPNLPSHPNLSYKIYETAQELLWGDKAEEAILKFQEAITLNPSLGGEPKVEAKRLAVENLMEQGRSLALTGDIDGAINRYRETLILTPTLVLIPEAQARFEYGRALKSRGDTDSAIEQLEQAIRLDPAQTFAGRGELVQQYEEKASGLAASGNLTDAIGLYQKALDLDPTLPITPAVETNRQYALTVMKQARQLAASGQITAAMAIFQQALELDPKLNLDPQREANHEYAFGLTSQATQLALSGEITASLAAISRALELDPQVGISAETWNLICWGGALRGLVARVMLACDRAVAAAPDDGGIRDSRGLARALTGDVNGAVEDLQFFVKQRGGNESSEVWIERLKAGEDPAIIFDAETLAALKGQ